MQWEGLRCPRCPFQLYNSVVARVLISYLPATALGVTPWPDSLAVGFKKAWLCCHREQGLIHKRPDRLDPAGSSLGLKLMGFLHAPLSGKQPGHPLARLPRPCERSEGDLVTKSGDHPLAFPTRPQDAEPEAPQAAQHRPDAPGRCPPSHG